jgi:D-alanine-D-alanine ligase-like ATP-grasp enzyme
MKALVLACVKLSSLEDLQPAYEFAAQYDREIIAETWITGREYTVVILAVIKPYLSFVYSPIKVMAFMILMPSIQRR